MPKLAQDLRLEFQRGSCRNRMLTLTAILPDAGDDEYLSPMFQKNS
jgi:hypothetical protein